MIARQTGLDRKTVPKYVKQGLRAPRYGPRAPRPQLLDPYRAYVRERVEAYPRIRAIRLLREIRQLGYPGCYSQLTVYLRDIRPPPDRGFETAPGEQAQVDFAQFKADFTEEPGRIRVVWLFSLVLGHCRWLTGQFVHGQHLASVAGRDVSLTRTEFEVLRALSVNGGRRGPLPDGFMKCGRPREQAGPGKAPLPKIPGSRQPDYHHKFITSSW